MSGELPSAGIAAIPTVAADVTTRVNNVRSVDMSMIRRAKLEFVIGSINHPAGICDIPTIVTDITIRIYVACTTNTTTVRRELNILDSLLLSRISFWS